LGTVPSQFGKSEGIKMTLTELTEDAAFCVKTPAIRPNRIPRISSRTRARDVPVVMASIRRLVASQSVDSGIKQLSEAGFGEWLAMLADRLSVELRKFLGADLHRVVIFAGVSTVP
jgi:hypothetical protein